MVTRDEILSRLREGNSMEVVGRQLGMPAGKVYMIATGVPADGSDSLGAEDYRREGLQLGGTQALLGVPHENPNEPGDKPEVMAWVRDRALGDAQMQSAARRQSQGDKKADK